MLTGWDVLLEARPVGKRVVVLDDDGAPLRRRGHRGAARPRRRGRARHAAGHALFPGIFTTLDMAHLYGRLLGKGLALPAELLGERDRRRHGDDLQPLHGRRRRRSRASTPSCSRRARRRTTSSTSRSRARSRTCTASATASHRASSTTRSTRASSPAASCGRPRSTTATSTRANSSASRRSPSRPRRSATRRDAVSLVRGGGAEAPDDLHPGVWQRVVDRDAGGDRDDGGDVDAVEEAVAAVRLVERRRRRPAPRRRR